MNRKTVLGVGIVVLLLMGSPIINLAQAQSSKAQLTNLVAQLQKSPDDNTLRKKIIETVLAMPSPPAAPETLYQVLGKAKYALKDAKSSSGYKEAVEAYKQASLLAPWDGDIYYNLGVVQEKAGEPKAAINSFTLYLLAKPNAEDRKQVNEKIGGLQYETDKKNLKHISKKNNSEKNGKFRFLEGTWRGTATSVCNCPWNGKVDNVEYVITIKGKDVFITGDKKRTVKGVIEGDDYTSIKWVVKTTASEQNSLPDYPLDLKIDKTGSEIHWKQPGSQLGDSGVWTWNWGFYGEINLTKLKFP